MTLGRIDGSVDLTLAPESGVCVTMTGFSDLPNELVVEVWCLLRDPEDIEAFALTSKRVYALGSDAIAAHNELRSRFWSIRHDPDDLTSTPADTLRSLLLNPRAALYVRNLTIDGWRQDRRRRPNRLPSVTAFSRQVLACSCIMKRLSRRQCRGSRSHRQTRGADCTCFEFRIVSWRGRSSHNLTISQSHCTCDAYF